MSALEPLLAALTPEQTAMIAQVHAFAPELVERDDAMGVQKRFDPVEEAFLVCLIHEVNRSRARGVPPLTVYDGLVGVLAKMIRLVARNAAAQSNGDEAAAIDFIGEAAQKSARALYRGTADGMIQSTPVSIPASWGGHA